MDVLALVLKQLAALGVPGMRDIARLCRRIDQEFSDRRTGVLTFCCSSF